MTFEDTLDEELLYLYKCKSQDMVYYQCAEGETWYHERAAREECKQELAEIRKECNNRGIEIPVTQHFV